MAWTHFLDLGRAQLRIEKTVLFLKAKYIFFLERKQKRLIFSKKKINMLPFSGGLQPIMIPT